VFAQTKSGSFATEGKTVDFAFEARGNRWLDDIQAQERNADQSKFKDVTIYRIIDLDNDGVTDVITVSNEASGLFDRRQSFQVYRGRINNELISWPAVADHQFSVEGVGGVGFRDVNNDGRRDLVATSVKISLGKIIAFLVNRSVKTKTQVQVDNGAGAYIEDDDYRRTYSIGIDLSRGITKNPPLDYEDFNGDDALDLMIGDGKDKLTIYKGGKDDPFKTRLATLETPLPSEGYLVEALDLNGDKAADIVIRYSRLGFDGEEARHKLVIFVSERG